VLVEGLEAGQGVTILNGHPPTVVEVGSGSGLDTEDDENATALLTTADIEASNGGVPMIDAALLPNEPPAVLTH
jgi:uncharacterized surface protein with fasciclin (FAS1) repeats